MGLESDVSGGSKSSAVAVVDARASSVCIRELQKSKCDEGERAPHSPRVSRARRRNPLPSRGVRQRHRLSARRIESTNGMIVNGRIHLCQTDFEKSLDSTQTASDWFQLDQ